MKKKKKIIILLGIVILIVLSIVAIFTCNINISSQVRIEENFYVECLANGGIEIVKDNSNNVFFEKIYFSKIDTNTKNVVAIDTDGKLYQWKNIDDGLTNEVIYPMGDIKVKEVSMGDNHIVAISSEGKLFVWGSNEYNQLGLGNDNINTMIDEPIILEVENENFNKVSCGPLSTIAITDCGRVYEWGYSEKVISEFEVETTQIAIPTKVNLDYQIVDADNGFLFNILLTEDGKVLGRGRNEYGQCLPNSEEVYINDYKLLELPENICEISAGNDHVLALGSSGTVYSWGNNEFGQVGKENSVKEIVNLINIEGKGKYIFATDNNSVVISDSKKYCFGKISSNLVDTINRKGYEKLFVTERTIETKIGSILKISSGYATSALIDSSQNAYIWGMYLDGVLGNKETVDIDKPQKIEKLKSNCLDIETNSGITTILTSTGKVYNFGNNQNSRLGIGNSINQWEPAQVKINEKITRFFMGPSATIVNTELGEWYAWGNNKYGSLLTGDTNLYSTPTKINIPFDVEKISSYVTHTLLLDTDGNVYQYGSVDFDADNELDFKKISIDEKIVDISVGPQLCFAVSESGIVYTWGNNIYGYLGLEDKEIYTKPQKINFEEKITKVEVSPMLCQIVALSGSGNVYVWGFNSMKLLDKQILEMPTKVELNEKISDIVVGDVTVYALAESGNTFTWGGVINNVDKKPQREPILYSFE